MQTDTFSKKISAVANKVIGKLMAVSGIVALVWILAFLLVAIIEK